MTKRAIVAAIILAVILAGCGTVKEKTAPCKRPADLTPFAASHGADCSPMHPVNDPTAAFAAVGLIDQ